MNKRNLIILVLILVVLGGGAYQFLGLGKGLKGSFADFEKNKGLSEKADSGSIKPVGDSAFADINDGALVLGQGYNDPNQWYPGKISKVYGNDGFRLDYFDGGVHGDKKDNQKPKKQIARFDLHPSLKSLKEGDIIIVKSQNDKDSQNIPRYYSAKVDSTDGKGQIHITKIGTNNTQAKNINITDIFYPTEKITALGENQISDEKVKAILTNNLKFEKTKGKWDKGTCAEADCAMQSQDPATGDLSVHYRIYAENSKELGSLGVKGLSLAVIRKPLWGDPKSADSQFDNTEEKNTAITYGPFPINVSSGNLDVAGTSQSEIKNTKIEGVPGGKQAVSIIQNPDDKESIFVSVKIPFPVFPGAFNEGATYTSNAFDKDGNTTDGWGQTEIDFIVYDETKQIKLTDLSTNDGKEYVTERIGKPIVIVSRKKSNDEIKFKNSGAGMIPYNYYKKISYYADNSSSIKGPTTLFHLFWDYDDNDFSFGYKVDEDNKGANPLPWYQGEGTDWHDFAYDTTGTKSLLLYDYKGTDWNWWNGASPLTGQNGVGINNPIIYSATVDGN